MLVREYSSCDGMNKSHTGVHLSCVTVRDD